MGWITDLLKELPLSAVQRERFALEEAKFNTKLSTLEAENRTLRAEKEYFCSQANELQAQIDQIRQAQAEADRQQQKQLAGANRLPTERETVLKIICFHPDREPPQVAGIAGFTPEVTQWHIDALEKAKLVSCSYTVGTPWAKGSRFLTVTDSGRDYLATHGMLQA